MKVGTCLNVGKKRQCARDVFCRGTIGSNDGSLWVSPLMHFGEKVGSCFPWMIRDYKNNLFSSTGHLLSIDICVYPSYILNTTGPEEGHNIDKEGVQACN